MKTRLHNGQGIWEALVKQSDTRIEGSAAKQGDLPKAAVNLPPGCSSFELQGVAQQQAKPLSADIPLPVRYGCEYLRLMFQDPFTLYCYWEVCEQTLAEHAKAAGAGGSFVLRVDREGSEPYDIEAGETCGSKYINLEDGGGIYFVIYGLRTADGRFISILRSNRVALPPTGVSAAADEAGQSEAEFIPELFADVGLPDSPNSLQLQSSAFRLHNLSSASLVRKKTF